MRITRLVPIRIPQEGLNLVATIIEEKKVPVLRSRFSNRLLRDNKVPLQSLKLSLLAIARNAGYIVRRMSYLSRADSGLRGSNKWQCYSPGAGRDLSFQAAGEQSKSKIMLHSRQASAPRGWQKFLALERRGGIVAHFETDAEVLIAGYL
jgi:hypothetical protein